MNGSGVGRFFRGAEFSSMGSHMNLGISIMVGFWLGLTLIAQADSANEAGDACACSRWTIKASTG